MKMRVLGTERMSSLHENCTAYILLRSKLLSQTTLSKDFVALDGLER